MRGKWDQGERGRLRGKGEIEGKVGSRGKGEIEGKGGIKGKGGIGRLRRRLRGKGLRRKRD